MSRLASWFGFLSPMSKNSILEELRVRRLAVIQEEICWRASWRWDAWVKVDWVEREEELRVVCIKVMVKEKGKDQSTERGNPKL